MPQPNNEFWIRASDDDLVRRFVASFERHDDLIAFPCDAPPGELAVGPDPNFGECIRWNPRAISTPRSQLEPIYNRLPCPFPALYERLVLTYRWMEVYLESVALLANSPGPTLSGLMKEIFRDSTFVAVLIPAGFVPFAKGTESIYNPVCFDTNAMMDGDCPVIQFEHEEILCHNRIGENWQVSSSFRELMVQTIDLAQFRPNS